MNVTKQHLDLVVDEITQEPRAIHNCHLWILVRQYRLLRTNSIIAEICKCYLELIEAPKPAISMVPRYVFVEDVKNQVIQILHAAETDTLKIAS